MSKAVCVSKVQKVLSSSSRVRVDSTDMVTVLKALSSFYLKDQLTQPQQQSQQQWRQGQEDKEAQPEEKKDRDKYKEVPSDGDRVRNMQGRTDGAAVSYGRRPTAPLPSSRLARLREIRSKNKPGSATHSDAAWSESNALERAGPSSSSTASAPSSTSAPSLKQNSLVARRNLISVLERRSVKTNTALVEAFNRVKDQLEEVEKVINSLASDCNDVSMRLETARKDTSFLLSQTTSLQQQRKILESKQKVVGTFLSRFQLTPQEISALDGEVNKDFFVALNRILQIRNDCRELLQSYHQRVGLDIVDSLGKRIEAAYEKLYLWVQDQGRALNVSSPDVTPLFVMALSALRQRPAYFNHCCQEIFQARRVLLIRRFITALTRGGANGARPIEIHVHDPIRYVSDMLAWVHQAIASEKDFFDTIMTDEVKAGKSDFDPLGEVFEGISKPLRTRVEQALMSHSEPVLALQILNILDFYGTTIGSLLSVGTKFTETLSALKDLASRTCYKLIQEQMDKLKSSPPPYTHDLSPPRAVVEILSQLNKLMAVYSSSLIPVERRDAEFSSILAAIVDPVLEVTHISGHDLDPLDTAVYELNILNAINVTIKKYDFTRSRQETIALATASLTERLTSVQTNLLLAKFGLDDKLKKIDEYFKAMSESKEAVVPLSNVQGLDSQTLTLALQGFYKLLFDAGNFVMPQCDRILNTNVRKIVQDELSKQMASSYAILYKEIFDPRNQYPNPLEIAPHTPQQINTILNIK